MFEYTTSRFKNTFWDQSEKEKNKKKGERKRRRGRERDGWRGGNLRSNNIMGTKAYGLWISFAKTVRQIVVKEWPTSRH